jgi:hypothetical protein
MQKTEKFISSGIMMIIQNLYNIIGTSGGFTEESCQTAGNKPSYSKITGFVCEDAETNHSDRH